MNLRMFQMKSGWAGPPCPIKVKEASYAIVRASSNSCRQLIAETACHVQEGTFFPKQLPRMCPLQGKLNTILTQCGLVQ